MHRQCRLNCTETKRKAAPEARSRIQHTFESAQTQYHESYKCSLLYISQVISTDAMVTTKLQWH